ncbi:MAG: hypothetical protein IGS50_17660 [Synechococcales cyanobacterium C42_A2020_086]|jgi:hypothetical protein|nr:hypothetical protein [Synechococcales cyanobacterium M58_A2018_015]MBF2075569.1 hypothetical protein [Synechococcales cyanobacterium C42_A2020_086]
MSRVAITDLHFVEAVSCEPVLMGGGRRITPRVSTAAATASDTLLITHASVEGNLLSGFKTKRFARGSAAAAAAAAVSIGGTASAEAYASADG